MHVNKEILHEENRRTTWETLHWCCVVKKVIRKEVTTGGRFDFFWALYIFY